MEVICTKLANELGYHLVWSYFWGIIVHIVGIFLYVYIYIYTIYIYLYIYQYYAIYVYTIYYICMDCWKWKWQKKQKQRMISGYRTTLETSRWTYDPANMGILGYRIHLYRMSTDPVHILVGNLEHVFFHILGIVIPSD